MIIIPAVDIKQGKCVRLLQGRMEESTCYCDDPAEMAKRWESEGASLIHVVDLDGAFAKKIRNLASIRDILKAVNVPIQVGGGIRDAETIEMLLDEGVSKVIIGSETFITLILCARHVNCFRVKLLWGLMPETEWWQWKGGA